MTSITPTIFLDFDGTITIRDATDAILEAYAAPQWLELEEAWKSGRIGSRECLAEQVALVRASRRAVNTLLDEIEIDRGFVPLLALCTARGLPVHIVSDGFDYCIHRILGRPSLRLAPYLRNVRVVSSHLEADDARWQASFASPSPACVHGCATCKPAAMDRLRAPGSPTIFVGDGLSDRYAARAADMVFAKAGLAVECDERSISYTPYADLVTVARRLEQLLESESMMQTAFSGKALPTT